MREIKFRAWHEVTFHNEGKDSKRGTMEYFGLLWGNSFVDERSFVGHAIRFGIVMQYTDLKDCNGKEIYDGDICKQTRFHKEERLVVLCKSACQWSVRDILKEGPLACYGTIDEALVGCEVIGNIHENPELQELTDNP